MINSSCFFLSISSLFGISTNVSHLHNSTHYYSFNCRELTEDAQKILGDIPEEFTNYWLRTFPKLLLHVWSRASILKEESVFRRYYNGVDEECFDFPPPPAPISEPTKPPIAPQPPPGVTPPVMIDSELPLDESGAGLEWRRNGTVNGNGVAGESPKKWNPNQAGKNKYRNAKKRQSGKSRSDRENWREKSVERECEA
jgi:hypothetical protein